MDMAREELGLVWMGDMLLQSDPMMLDHAADTPYFTDPQPSLDDLSSRTALCLEPPYQHEMNGFMLLGEQFDDPYYEASDDGKYGVTTAATQTAAEPRSRKIKPVKHPGLKLQTPIAYQRDTDPSVIPIQRDGMAVCEKCGAMGVKHAFYTKERRFCSMNCVRGASEMDTSWNEMNNQVLDEKNWETMCYEMQQQQQQQQQQPQQSLKLEVNMEKIPPLPPRPPALPPDDPHFPPDKTRIPELQGTFEWVHQLNDKTFLAAPVSNFRHAPMADCWDNITTGMKVEVENFDCENFSEDFPNSFWVATVLKVSGYMAQLRYEGFGLNSEKDFWVNLCSSSVHPVGWCATRGKPLIPPKTIEGRYKDWKNFLVKRLTGARTLPSNFYSKVHDSLRSRFRCDLNLEVVDKNRICQVKIATIKKIVGKRLNIKYYDANTEEHDGFWCHEDSPLIHPVGWARRVGQQIDAPPAYMDRCIKGLRDKDDATEDLFPLPPYAPPPPHSFREGMKLEAVDPLNLSTICAATVMRVLNEGYIMIRVDSYEEVSGAEGSDWFCYHWSSPYIFPAGFCHSRDIPLLAPKGWDNATFSWTDYLRATGCELAPAHLFNMEVPAHGFVAGMKLEAVDLMDPRLVCVATISRVIGRLLRIRFDGWEEEYDQWLDCCSSDMFPVGWCQLVAHKLEAPPSPLKNGLANHPGKGGARRKKRRRMAGKKVGGGMAGRKLPLSDSPQPPTVHAQSSPQAPAMHIQSEYAWLAEPLPSEMLSGEENLSLVEESLAEPSTGQPEVAMSVPPPAPALMCSMPSLPDPLGPQLCPPLDAALPTIPAPLPFTTTAVHPPIAGQMVQEVNGWTSNSQPQSQPLVQTHTIPRLSETRTYDSRDLVPHLWSCADVAEFLRVNDWGVYSDTFVSKSITGEQLLKLTYEDIMELTGRKMGPSVKIENLIKDLRMKVNPAQERLKASLKKLL